MYFQPIRRKTKNNGDVPDVRFPALGTSCTFSRAWHELHFSRDWHELHFLMLIRFSYKFYNLQSAFYPWSVGCTLRSVCILLPVRSLQSAVLILDRPMQEIARYEQQFHAGQFHSPPSTRPVGTTLLNSGKIVRLDASHHQAVA